MFVVIHQLCDFADKTDGCFNTARESLASAPLHLDDPRTPCAS